MDIFVKAIHKLCVIFRQNYGVIGQTFYKIGTFHIVSHERLNLNYFTSNFEVKYWNRSRVCVYLSVCLYKTTVPQRPLKGIF